MAEKPLPVQLILASGSPRRRELLAQAGIPFMLDVPNVDENLTGLPARELVCELALRKGRAVAARHDGGLVLAADTVVDQEGILGKPADEGEAVAMLTRLSGAWHSVWTGICLWDCETGRHEVGAVCTRVKFQQMDHEVIEAYVATGEPMDKAGAYAMQGKAGLYIEEIIGSPTNVIGLPLGEVRRMLSDFGIEV